MSVSAMERYFGKRGADRRRKHSDVRKTFQVEKIWNIHHEISRLKVLGFNNRKIADALGVSQAMVGYTVNSPVIEDRISIMQGARDCDTIDLARRIKEFAPKCLDILESVIKGDEEAPIGLRVRTAQDYADRAGLGAVKKHQVLSAKLSLEELNEIKQRARENGILQVCDEAA
jgi:hypothetical protein